MVQHEDEWIKHGQGKMVYPEGHVYKYYNGNWNNNKFDGEGILKYTNGEKYDGQFKNG